MNMVLFRPQNEGRAFFFAKKSFKGKTFSLRNHSDPQPKETRFVDGALPGHGEGTRGAVGAWDDGAAAFNDGESPCCLAYRSCRACFSGFDSGREQARAVRSRAARHGLCVCACVRACTRERAGACAPGSDDAGDSVGDAEQKSTTQVRVCRLKCFCSHS